MHRRALLKGAATTMPMILTLQSGAALARSSNLISATKYGARDEHGRTLCLDLDSVYPAGEYGHKYDLGEPAYGQVFAINNRDHRVRPRYRSRRIGERRMCRRGGTYYYRRRHWWDDDGDSDSDSDEHDDYDDYDDYDDKGQNDFAATTNTYGSYGPNHGWQEVNVPKGILVSATALNSFAGNIHIYDI